MDPVWLLFVILGVYVFCGAFVALVMYAIISLEGGDLDAEAMTAISMFWPFTLPDLLFRLVMGRWFGMPRQSKHDR